MSKTPDPRKLTGEERAYMADLQAENARLTAALRDVLWTAMVGENTGSSALKACGKIRLAADAALTQKGETP